MSRKASRLWCWNRPRDSTELVIKYKLASSSLNAGGRKLMSEELGPVPNTSSVPSPQGPSSKEWGRVAAEQPKSMAGSPSSGRLQHCAHLFHKRSAPSLVLYWHILRTRQSWGLTLSGLHTSLAKHGRSALSNKLATRNTWLLNTWDVANPNWEVL